jgi:hypothetical protein
MTNDQISTGNRSEPGFGFGSFLLRLLFALLIVLLTYNPSGFSFLHWTKDAFLSSSLGPLHFLAGISLLIGWVVFVHATTQSLGLLGIVLVAALFGVLVWMLFFYDVLKTGSAATITWIVLIGVSVVLTIGVSWAHIRRRLSGQATVDEVKD